MASSPSLSSQSSAATTSSTQASPTAPVYLTQVQHLGYDIEMYVDGTLTPPPRTLPGDETTINPAYRAWRKQDKLIFSWLLSSLSEIVITRVVGLTTSGEGSLSMPNYFQHAKRLSDALAASGKPVSNSELRSMLLTGLDPVYDPIVTALTATTVDIPLADFKHISLLLR
ncbi:hypothetical protein BVC80_8857g28 [Macleaya cordata]|uniref:Uncharacterized protein n=1 Tax=Macleaya cordata TaxID=56857 RepID=A0A200PY28_MACCD|nr:hypothetical protein BVC80_8857g28 [Macleaya cordata]